MILIWLLIFDLFDDILNFHHLLRPDFKWHIFVGQVAYLPLSRPVAEVIPPSPSPGMMKMAENAARRDHAGTSKKGFFPTFPERFQLKQLGQDRLSLF